MSLRVIVIDPFRFAVEERVIEGDNEFHWGEKIREIIGDSFCLACAVPVSAVAPDVCYVDENGLYKHSQGFVLHGWGHQPFMGTGVIVGSDQIGGTVSARVPLSAVLRRLVWAVPAGVDVKPTPV